MADTASKLEEQAYVHLPAFLDTENCKQLTQELVQIVNSGGSHKDDQCPLSEAVRIAPVFDSLLEQLLPHVEKASGKSLYPTYSYARMYSSNDDLKAHKDRDACEISVTITLGYEGKQWPIYMGDREDKQNGSAISMSIGDAVLYKGREKWHWREKFEGQWQAQVFLHYVDANGPFKHLKYDGREKLSHHLQGPDDLLFRTFENAISPDVCKQIIEITERNCMDTGRVGTGEGVLDTNTRNVNRVGLSLWRGIGATLTGIGINSNAENWKFDITHSNQADYLKYDETGHYTAHVDTVLTKSSECRKLTVLAFLNDDFEGGKLFLIVGDQKIYPPQLPGSVLVFPSFILHGVEPVTSGTRRTVVTWLIGPWFK